MTPLVDLIISALVVLGGLLGLVGSWGLLKLPDLVTRLHGPTKTTTLGVGSVLLGSAIYFAVYQDTVTWKELIIAAFLFITAPVTALFLSKVHLHRSLSRDDLPPTGGDSVWATYGTGEADPAGPSGPETEKPDAP